MRNLKITVNGKTYDVQVEESGAVYSAPAAAAPVSAAPAPTPAVTNAPAPAQTSAPAPAEEQSAPAAAAPVSGDGEVIESPMPGTILDVKVSAGSTVKKGDVLVILEAMKMENEIVALHDATVAAVHISKGSSVNAGDPLVTLG